MNHVGSIFIPMGLLGVLLSGCAIQEPSTPSPKSVTSPGESGTAPQEQSITPVEKAPVGDEQPRPERVKELTLTRAFELAERIHPDLVASLERVKAAKGRALQAGLLPNPEAVAGMESVPFDRDATNVAEYLVGVTQEIPVGGRLSAARQVELLEQKRWEAELEAQRLKIRRRIQGTYATALYAENVLGVVADRRKQVGQIESIARLRLAQGEATPDEVARAEMVVARAKLEQDRARSLERQARAALVAAIGDPKLVVGSLEGSLESTLELPALETLSARLKQSPVLMAAEAEIAAQEARLTLAEKDRIPDVNLGLFYRRIQFIEENTFDIGLSIPLPIFDRNQGRLQEARARVAESEARARTTRNSLQLELQDSHFRLSQALAVANVLREDVVPRAEALRRSARNLYQGGDISLWEYLLVEKEWLAGRLEYLESLHNVMQAWADLSSIVRSSHIDRI